MKKILIVEDDVRLLKLYSRFLTSERYPVASFSDAAQAAEYIRRENFNLLITDYHLGSSTGGELISLMKGINPLAKALLITGDEGLAGTRGPGPEYADSDALIKPFSMDALLNIVRELLDAQPLAPAEEPS